MELDDALLVLKNTNQKKNKTILTALSLSTNHDVVTQHNLQTLL